MLKRVLIPVNESGAMAAVGLRERLQERPGCSKLLKDFEGVVLASVVYDNEPRIGITVCLNDRIPVIDKLSDIVFFVIGGDYYIKRFCIFCLVGGVFTLRIDLLTIFDYQKHNLHYLELIQRLQKRGLLQSI